MSNTPSINWRALPPALQNRLVATVLFGWQAVPCDNEKEISDDGSAWCPSCHVRAFIGDFEHGIIEPPNYVKDWNAAMKVLQEVAKRYHVRQEAIDPMYETFTDELLKDAHGTWGDVLGLEVPSLIAAWTPERIAIAALRAYGIEVITGEVQSGGHV